MATLAEGMNSAYAEIFAENSSNETPSDVLPTTNTTKTSRKRKRIHSIFPEPQQQNQIFNPGLAENVSLKTISSAVGPSTSANNGQIESQSTGISTVSLEKVVETKDVHSQKSKGSYQPWNEKTIEHFSEALKQVKSKKSVSFFRFRTDFCFCLVRQRLGINKRLYRSQIENWC